MQDDPASEQIFEGRRTVSRGVDRVSMIALIVGIVIGGTGAAVMPSVVGGPSVSVTAVCEIDIDGYPTLTTRVLFSSGQPRDRLSRRHLRVVYAIRAPLTWEISPYRPDPPSLASSEQRAVDRWLEGAGRVTLLGNALVAAREAAITVPVLYRARSESRIIVDVLLIDVDGSVDEANVNLSCPAGEPPIGGPIRAFPP